MIRYKKAAETDYPLLRRLLGRVSLSASYDGFLFPSSPCNEKSLKESILGQNAFLAMEGKTLIGAAIVNKDVSSFFFPSSHDGGKLMDLVNRTEWKMNEDMLVLSLLAIDPLFRRKGIGSELLRFVEASYPRFLYFALADPNNEGGIAFLKKRGYKRIGVELYEGREAEEQLLFKRL